MKTSQKVTGNGQTKKAELQTELTDKQIKSLEKSILKHFKENGRFDRFDKMVMIDTVAQMNDFLGLAYTSSSSFAMLSICNTEVFFDLQKKYNYVCFGMDENTLKFVALLHDAEENELYINI